jgi:hypothetical protein
MDSHRRGARRNAVAELDPELLIDFVLAHKLAFTRDFLKNRELPYSGTSSTLRGRLSAYLSQDPARAEDLLRFLDHIEGWGDQHIYLLQAPTALSSQWRDKVWVRGHLRSEGYESLLNRHLPAFLPDAPTLSSIQHSDDHVRLIWVERRTWEERLPDEDTAEGDIVRRAYKVRRERGIMVFDWDLIAGTAMFMIRRLPTGTNYRENMARYAALMHGLVDLSLFAPADIRRAIKAIEQCTEVRLRQTNWETARGGRASLRSAGKALNYSLDPQLAAARLALGGQVSGQLGNFYWLAGPALASEVHTHLYGDDNRVGLFGEHAEEAVRHVLARIRDYSH